MYWPGAPFSKAATYLSSASSHWAVLTGTLRATVGFVPPLDLSAGPRSTTTGGLRVYWDMNVKPPTPATRMTSGNTTCNNVFMGAGPESVPLGEFERAVRVFYRILRGSARRGSGGSGPFLQG